MEWIERSPALLADAESPMDDAPDRLLFDRFRGGDRDAFAGLYRQHHRAIFQFALHMTGDASTAVVNERWFSDELQALIKSSNSDPRFGDTTYDLTNIVRGAPDPALFQIPADYTKK